MRRRVTTDYPRDAAALRLLSKLDLPLEIVRLVGEYAVQSPLARFSMAGRVDGAVLARLLRPHIDDVVAKLKRTKHFGRVVAVARGAAVALPAPKKPKKKPLPKRRWNASSIKRDPRGVARHCLRGHAAGGVSMGAGRLVGLPYSRRESRPSSWPGPRRPCAVSCVNSTTRASSFMTGWARRPGVSLALMIDVAQAALNLMPMELDSRSTRPPHLEIFSWVLEIASRLRSDLLTGTTSLVLRRLSTASG